jgi:hypothetical protein
MKHKISLIIIILALYGCDPVKCVEYNIENNVNMDIVVNFYDSGKSVSSFQIVSGKISTLLKNCEKGGAGLSLEFYDSIIVYNDNSPLIQYYQSSDLDNNIYKLEDNEVWITEKIDDDLTKYTFTITEKDLK